MTYTQNKPKAAVILLSKGTATVNLENNNISGKFKAGDCKEYFDELKKIIRGEC